MEPHKKSGVETDEPFGWLLNTHGFRLMVVERRRNKERAREREGGGVERG